MDGTFKKITYVSPQTVNKGKEGNKDETQKKERKKKPERN